METKTVRISSESHNRLREVAERESISMADAIDRIVEQWEQQNFFNELDAAYSRLKSDPEAWAEEMKEREEWDATLGDDLSDD